MLAFDFYANGFSNPFLALKIEDVREKRLSASASEMKCLILCFAFIVGDLIPHENPVWRYYLVLRQMLDIIFARKIQLSSVGLLKTLVKEHNSLYIELFQDTLKSKHHFLVHYPRALLKSGPLPFLDSMRYESKHRDVKRSASNTQSRRNVTHTSALKCQLNLCRRFLFRRGCSLPHDSGPATVVHDITLTDYDFFKIV